MELQEIKLCTSNLSLLYNFYKNVLALPVNYDEKKISISAGRSRLIFENCFGVSGAYYHFAFTIPSNKFEEAFEWLQHKTTLLWLDDYKSYIAEFVNWNARSVYFPDPAGNIVELIARFDLKETEDEPFSPKQFRCISEIGLVFSQENFEEQAGKLLHKYSLQNFSKQPPMPHFRAIGDDEGLFIVVPENRTWFATRKPSIIFPMEVSFVNSNKLYNLNM